MQDNEKLKNLFSGRCLNEIFGSSSNTPKEETPSAKEEAEVAIDELRNRYSQKIREDFELSSKKLKEERDAALRENWILQQQAEAALPEQMAASGLNGGAAETTLAAMKAKYQGDRNGINSEYMNNLGELAKQSQSDRQNAERGYNEQWLDYLLSLAEMEQQYKYSK